MRAKKLIVGAAVATGGVALAMMAPAAAGAQALTDVEVLGRQVSLLWVVLGAMLVIFMQAGFALVETGFCRAKHATHVVSTNFAIFGLGFVAYFLVGFAFMYGGFSYSAFGMDKAIGFRHEKMD
jgi:Amt family ammonium transporter